MQLATPAVYSSETKFGLSCRVTRGSAAMALGAFLRYAWIIRMHCQMRLLFLCCHFCFTTILSTKLYFSFFSRLLSDIRVTSPDVNECVSSSHGCHSNAACHNTDGSFECQCEDGFLGDGRQCAGQTCLVPLFIYFFLWTFEELRRIGSERWRTIEERRERERERERERDRNRDRDRERDIYTVLYKIERE